MRLGKERVGANVDCGRHTDFGQLGAMNSVIAGKRFRYFGTDFD